MAETLTDRQQRQLQGWFERLQTLEAWSDACPVVLWDRAWLRIQAVPVAQLASVLPPDATAEAPELVHYRQLLATGLDPWTVQQQCWHEFGAPACCQALRRYWQVQECGNHGWDLQRYLDLLLEYRRRFGLASPCPLPVLVLAREGQREPHQLDWFLGLSSAMRHTCA